MKKLFKVVSVAVLSLGFGVVANAQVRNANISAKATVVDQLEVKNLQDLDFGVVMQGANKMVDVAGAVTSTDGASVSSTAKVGQFSILAGVGSSITIKVDVPSTLTGPQGSTPMPVVFNRNLADDADAITVGYGIASSSVLPLNVNANNPISMPDTKIGEKTGTYVWIGGVVKPSATQANGAYSGTITLTASYN